MPASWTGGRRCRSLPLLRAEPSAGALRPVCILPPRPTQPALESAPRGRVLFHEKRAYGWSTSGRVLKNSRAQREVVCPPAFGSPAILLRSGVGRLRNCRSGEFHNSRKLPSDKPAGSRQVGILASHSTFFHRHACRKHVSWLVGSRSEDHRQARCQLIFACVHPSGVQRNRRSAELRQGRGSAALGELNRRRSSTALPVGSTRRRGPRRRSELAGRSVRQSVNEYRGEETRPVQPSRVMPAARFHRTDRGTLWHPVGTCRMGETPARRGLEFGCGGSSDCVWSTPRDAASLQEHECTDHGCLACASGPDSGSATDVHLTITASRKTGS